MLRLPIYFCVVCAANQKGGTLIAESFTRGALTEATYLILLSLREMRHGYGVMQHIEAITKGRVTLGMGTLYGAINLLLDKGWIALASEQDRKKLYRITPQGEHALETERQRLAELLFLSRPEIAQTGGNTSGASSGDSGENCQ